MSPPMSPLTHRTHILTTARSRRHADAHVAADVIKA
jgi:hypothetical protein